MRFVIFLLALGAGMASAQASKDSLVEKSTQTSIKQTKNYTVLSTESFFVYNHLLMNLPDEDLKKAVIYFHTKKGRKYVIYSSLQSKGRVLTVLEPFFIKQQNERQ